MIRIDRVVVPGVFSLDGQDFDVENNVWLVGDDDEVLVIDAPHDAARILEAVGGRRVTAIVLTHGHNDHINAAVALREAVGAPIWLHPADRMLWEMVHADQSPDHEAETWATLRSLPPHARHVRLTEPSVTAAVNAGVRLAGAPLLLFLDDDVEIDDRELLDRHVRHYDDPSVAGVVGRIVNAERRADLPRPAAAGALGFLQMNFDHPYAMDVPTAAGANMSFRRELVERLGGFDERYTANAFRWETDFSLRVIRAGYRIRYDPEARVLHHYGTPGGCDESLNNSVNIAAQNGSRV